MTKIGRQRFGQNIKHHIIGYTLVAPAILLLLVFTIYPIIYLIYSSLLSGSLICKNRQFVGIGNYIAILSSEDFRKVIWNTVVYSFVLVAVTMVLSILVAVWIHSKKDNKLNHFLQASVFAPHITSLVAISMVFLWLMDPQIGLFNSVLTFFGLKPFTFLAHPSTALFSLILVMIWKTVGYYTLLILAALQTIPVSIYEAAELDDAPKWRIFFRITLPMISPTLFFSTIIATIGSFRVFETVKLMTQGGPVNSTNTLVYYVYEYAFKYSKLGEASAAGVILLLIVIVLTILYFAFLSRRVHYR